MIELSATALTDDSFAPFGTVVELPPAAPRTDLMESLENVGLSGTPFLALLGYQPSEYPIVVSEMERHPYSAQLQLPLDASEYLILFAKSGADDRPDPQTLRSFVAQRCALVYRAGVWHTSLRTIRSTGHVAMFMWMTPDHTETVSLEQSVRVLPPVDASSA